MIERFCELCIKILSNQEVKEMKGIVNKYKWIFLILISFIISKIQIPVKYTEEISKLLIETIDYWDNNIQRGIHNEEVVLSCVRAVISLDNKKLLNEMKNELSLMGEEIIENNIAHYISSKKEKLSNLLQKIMNHKYDDEISNLSLEIQDIRSITYLIQEY